MCQSKHTPGLLKIDGTEYTFTSDDLQDLGEIGRGGFGTVNKMIHKKSGNVIAVKRIRSTVDENEQKQLLMDLDVVMKSNYSFIVQFYGALFKEVCSSLVSDFRIRCETEFLGRLLDLYGTDGHVPG